MERYVRSLPPDEVALCRYHRPGWPGAAEAAVECWSASGTEDPFGAAEWLNSEGLEDEDLWAAVSFFREPIWVDGKRLGTDNTVPCAMKVYGVRRCLAEAC